jgi:pimeloyl-ACP methyl ester carboxylesterase
MSEFLYKNKKVFYRTVGEGRPILLLNGIMMSTNSWKPFEKHFSNDNMLILLDFLDQGQSDKLEAGYNQSVQVNVVRALLDELGLDRISVIGTSYGGEVALQFAAKYPEKVERMVLANTVARTNAWLKEIGDAWNYAAKIPEAYYCTTIPTIYCPHYYDRKKEWMASRKDLLTKTAFADEDFLQSMIRLTNSAVDHDVTDKLSGIDVPTLIIGCEQDHITPLEEQRFLQQNMPNSELVILPETGHAAFYERPYLFTSIVMGFINLFDEEIRI